MEQNSLRADLDLENKRHENPETPSVDVTRVFKAPVKFLWEAWSNPEILKEWWGPKESATLHAEIDFRIGGQYLIAMKFPKEENLSWSAGVYQAISAPEMIIYNQHASDVTGKRVTGAWPVDAYITVAFEKNEPSINGSNREKHEQTRITITHQGVPKKLHGRCVKEWNQALDKLQKRVEN